MPSLLDIPTELRECIIRYVLDNHRTPPETPSKSNRVDFQDIDYMAWRRSQHGIYHEQRSTHCPSNCMSLLLTDRQLSVETKSVIERIKTTSYMLDIAVMNDMDLFPTWLSVPHITNRLSSLYVDVRLFGHVISEKDARSQVGDGGQLGFHWSFYALLERFLRYGPVGEKKGTPRRPKPRFGNPTFDDYNVTVKELVLDFKSAEPELSFPPDDVTCNTWLSWHFTSAYRPRSLPETHRYTTRPEWLSKFLKWEIDKLLGMSYHFESYGKILYERIGAIRILADGDLKDEFDLASMLAGLQFTTDHKLCEWKKQTLARRDQLGLNNEKGVFLEDERETL